MLNNYLTNCLVFCIEILYKKVKNKKNYRAGEMAQWLRALTGLPEVLSSIPSTHMVAHNHLHWGLMPSSGVSGESNGEYIF